jgi:hypothetical protein
MSFNQNIMQNPCQTKKTLGISLEVIKAPLYSPLWVTFYE